MWIEDPDGIRIVLVEIPADHPLRRDPRPASAPTMTSLTRKRMGRTAACWMTFLFDVNLNSPGEGDPGLPPKRANERPRSLPRSRKTPGRSHPPAGTLTPEPSWCLELAKLHMALAHLAATAQASDGREWVRVAGPWFGDMSLALHEQRQT
jgi:hypothetical protein